MLIYVVTDRRLRPDLGAEDLMRQVVRSGADMIQIREKDMPASRLLDCARAARSAAGRAGPDVYVNARVDVALAAEVAGVHLPAAGLPVEEVRRLWGSRLRIGVSTHGVDEARAAGRAGADFITFGPVFETESKRRYGAPQGVGRLIEVVEASVVPVLAIGGINRTTIRALEGIAIAGVAVVSAVVAARDMEAAVTELRGARG